MFFPFPDIVPTLMFMFSTVIELKNNGRASVKQFYYVHVQGQLGSVDKKIFLEILSPDM